MGGAVSTLIEQILFRFRDNPNDSNTTNSEIAEYIRKLNEANAARQKAEDDAKIAGDREESQRRQAEEAKMRQEKATRMAEEAMQHAKEDRENAEKSMREAQAASDQADEAFQAAEKQRIHAEKQQNILKSKLEQAQTYLRKGIQPAVWPTEKEFNDAKKRIQYRSDRLHFAVCGFTGTGKSSLINAFRGLTDLGDGAAPTGVVETTVAITRYPDTREEDPFPRFVWFDVPGGGGAKVSDWQYFNQQGLFIFDVILIVYDNRVTKLDISILDNCQRFKIPTFIVRSKADNHIRQVMKSLGYTKARRSEKEKFYTDACNKFIKETRRNLDETLRSANLPSQRVYIISSETVCGLSTKNLGEKIIDEKDLIQNVLQAAYDRRYGAPQETLEPHTKIVDLCVAAAREILHLQPSPEVPVL